MKEVPKGLQYIGSCCCWAKRSKCCTKQLPIPKKKKGDKLFTSKISVVAEETEVFSFTDLLSEAQESDCLLELGGTFQDPSGKGYLDSFGLKDYTEIN